MYNTKKINIIHSLSPPCLHALILCAVIQSSNIYYLITVAFVLSILTNSVLKNLRSLEKSDYRQNSSRTRINYDSHHWLCIQHTVPAPSFIPERYFVQLSALASHSSSAPVGISHPKYHGRTCYSLADGLLVHDRLRKKDMTEI